MINVQEITSRLSMMPDQQLTQYAAMNRTDPYILSLAMSEHNRRKQMRTAAQGAMMGQTPPPPVVDQLLQQMDADSVVQPRGIAALPADVDVSDGGIAGYAEGGEVSNRAAAQRQRERDAARREEERRAILERIEVGSAGTGRERSQADPQAVDALWGSIFGNTSAPAGRVATGAGAASATAPSLVDRANSMFAGSGTSSEPPAAPAATPPADTGIRTTNVLPPEGESANDGMTPYERQRIALMQQLTNQTRVAPEGNFGTLEAPDIRGQVGQARQAFMQDFQESEAQLRAEWEAGRPPPESFAERLALFQESKDTPDARRRIRGLAQLEAAAAIMQPDQHWMQAAINGLVTMGRSESEAVEELEAAELERRKSLAEVHEAVRAAERGYWQESAQFATSAHSRLQDLAGKLFQADLSSIEAQAGVDMDVQEANIGTRIEEAKLRQSAAEANARNSASLARSMGSAAGEGIELGDLEHIHNQLEQRVREATESVSLQHLPASQRDAIAREQVVGAWLQTYGNSPIGRAYVEQYIGARGVTPDQLQVQ